jgi:hypothetical protein
MTKKQYPKGLDERMRDQDGTIRKKRGDTKICMASPVTPGRRSCPGSGH